MTKYLQPTNIYSLAVIRQNEINEARLSVESRLCKYPPGKIHIVENSKGRVQYYLRKNSGERSGQYISKKDKSTIKWLLQKRYDEKIANLLTEEEKNLDIIIESISDMPEKIRKIYSDNPTEVKEFLTPIDISNDEYAQMWMAEPYIKKEVSSDLPTFITNRGERVRSKSELTIANILDRRGIPYKYECPLLLSNGRIIYPDFTLLNIYERRIIYWEHRGMMDDREYSRGAVNRVKMLSKEGIILGNNLILTEETQLYPLGTDEINLIIDTWFTKKYA